MAKSADALINPELLIWGRECSHIPIEIVAQRMGVPEEKIKNWELGESFPTIKQAKDLAHIYKQPFAAFYLSKPPTRTKMEVRDFRRLPSETLDSLSPELAFEIRRAIDRREIILEILDEENETAPTFDVSNTSNTDVEEIGASIRNHLGIQYDIQRRWREPNLAFNKWKEAIENIGVLVFQAKDVSINEIRGFSIYFDSLPIIVVNRKDAYAGRIFSLLHELTHLFSRTSGLCDLEPDSTIRPEIQQIEIFCNQVSASVLMPRKEFLNNAIVKKIGITGNCTDVDIQIVAANFGTSREAIVRRLLTFKLVSMGFYQLKREQYSEERVQIPAKKGHPLPDVNSVSLNGKPFSKYVLGAYNNGQITAGDVSDYLGVKTKHFKNIGDRLGV